jgi:hypothetical protein
MTAKVATESRKRASNPNRGSKPGERRGGRQKNTPNKATASIREIARQYTDEAILTLAEVMRDEEQPAPARVSAANALLDRGYGKPSTVLSDEDGNTAQIVHRVLLEGVKAGGG